MTGYTPEEIEKRRRDEARTHDFAMLSLVAIAIIVYLIKRFAL